MTAGDDPSGQPAAALSLEARALDLLDRALEQPLDRRRAWLRAQCGEDAALCARVLQLEGAERRCSDFLEAGLPILTPADRCGERLGAFELTSLLAVGGMSTVYRGRRADGRFEQDVAVKLIRVDLMDAETVARFRAEQQILASLEHPAIARLIDGGSAADGTPYVVLEYIRGQAITRYCTRQQLDVPARLRLFQQVCEALQVAHERGIVHRDIKAGNVLVTEDGQPKIIDFGIAKMLQPEAEELALPETRARTRLFTPEYASPEQVRGEPVTLACDVYSLGVLLYELLTGERPYRVAGLTPADIQSTVCDTLPANPSAAVGRQHETVPAGLGSTRQLQRRLHGDLDRIVMTALRKEVGGRYPSAQAFSADIGRHLAGQPVAARGASRWYRLGKFTARHRVGVAATATVMLVLAVALVVTLLQAREALRQKAVAEQQARRAESAKDFLVEMIRRTDPFANSESATLLDALKQAISKIDQRFAGQPLLEADLRYEIGYALQNLGEIPLAKVQLERAWELRRRHGSRLKQAEVLDGLGIVNWWESDFEKGNQRFAAALQQLGTDASPTGVQTRVDILANWSGMLITAGDNARSKQLALQALEAIKTPHADISVETQAAVWSNLATAQEGRGENEAALTAFHKTLDLQRQATGEMHPSYAIVLNNLALLYYKMGRQQDAADALTRSVEIRRRTLGENHPQTATALGNLARVQTEMGDLDAARTNALEALKVARNGYPANHPRIGKAHEALAHVYFKSGQLRQARDEVRAAHQIYAKAPDVDPAWVKKLNGLRGQIESAIHASTRVRDTPQHSSGAKGDR